MNLFVLGFFVLGFVILGFVVCLSILVLFLVLLLLLGLRRHQFHLLPYLLRQVIPHFRGVHFSGHGHLPGVAISLHRFHTFNNKKSNLNSQIQTQ